MPRSRPQFGLKTALVVTAILSVGCALVKYEHDADANFAIAMTTINGALKRIEPEADEALYQHWLQEVQSNPTYAANQWSSRMVVDNAGSEEGAISEYFGSSKDWHVIKNLPSPKIDFSRMPINSSKKHIDVEVICSRPWSVVSRQTSIQIIERPAPDNSLITDPLTAELQKAGVQFEVVKEFK
jgi:hypothetical protein